MQSRVYKKEKIYIFLQNNLHISKKSSTFAPYFNNGISNVIVSHIAVVGL